ncbi:hypothetical protein K5R88_07885 [Pseudomonas sp. MM213]|uniref:hypothetical protein n=1 Tax=Pseudomonas sp. MM213 TaxID=2866807 RepID=UPI001CF159C3|nr:hypothetical protein [Pseudomonas sp. MM213]UCP11543.1 hypothetical protein K5R88_07885 [Pseudomonas sp. MM213]
MMILTARLPNGAFEAPAKLGTQQYYGTSNLTPDVAFTKGLPLKGFCVDLLRHAGKGRDSRFRGTTPFLMVNEALGQGAVCWADEGGWVYELDNIPGWDVEKLLAGKVPTANGFAGAPFPGEMEGAIDSWILPSMIRRAGKVERSRRFLVVNEWTINKNCPNLAF